MWHGALPSKISSVKTKATKNLLAGGEGVGWAGWTAIQYLAAQAVLLPVKNTNSCFAKECNLMDGWIDRLYILVGRWMDTKSVVEIKNWSLTQTKTTIMRAKVLYSPASGFFKKIIILCLFSWSLKQGSKSTVDYCSQGAKLHMNKTKCSSKCSRSFFSSFSFYF